MTPEQEEQVRVFRVAMGCVLAAHDRDFTRMAELLEPLNKRQLRSLATCLSQMAAMGSPWDTRAGTERRAGMAAAGLLPPARADA